MTAMLASVNSLEEALLILNSGVGIIDLKQPEQGALGALDSVTVKAIVQAVSQKKPVSATIGDLPMHAELIFNAVTAMAKTGVDYIKIGFFPAGDWQATALKLTELTNQGYRLIAVLFADAAPDIKIISTLKKAGFTGVMLDTMDKSNGSLLTVMSAIEIKQFVNTVNKAQLLCGLAGSLKKSDISTLLALNVDYLGFRGALCDNHQRTACLNDEAVKLILSYFEPSMSHNVQ